MLVLIADPDPVQRHSLLQHCQRSGHEVCEEAEIEALASTVRTLCPDLVMLAWPRDEHPRRWVLQSLRDGEFGAAVIVVGPDQDAETVIACLEAGADDYVRRPFEPRELTARAEAIARRIRPAHQPVIRAGPVAIDDRCKRVTVYGAEIHLSPKEYLLLQLCAADPGRVFSHEEIIDRLWPERRATDPIDIKQYVHLLRTKLAKVPSGRNLIENVKGFGYRLAV